MTFLAVVSALQMMADYNVRNFGAKGDGATLDSPAINAEPSKRLLSMVADVSLCLPVAICRVPYA